MHRCSQTLANVSNRSSWWSNPRRFSNEDTIESDGERRSKNRLSLQRLHHWDWDCSRLTNDEEWYRWFCFGISPVLIRRTIWIWRETSWRSRVIDEDGDLTECFSVIQNGSSRHHWPHANPETDETLRLRINKMLGYSPQWPDRPCWYVSLPLLRRWTKREDDYYHLDNVQLLPEKQSDCSIRSSSRSSLTWRWYKLIS